MKANRHGAILIVVLVVVMMVSLAAYHFTMAMQSEHMATRNAGDQITARHCALSGIELVSATLQQPRYQRDRLAALSHVPIDLWPDESGDESPYRVTLSFPASFSTASPIAGSSSAGSFNIASSSARPLASGGLDSVPGLRDESAKIDLNALLRWDQEQPGTAREALLRLPEMDGATADRILDWIDDDSESRSRNSESGARNSVPLLIDELALLSVDRSEDGEVANAGDDGSPVRPAWLDHLTVCSAERNESFDGNPRIDVNDPDLLQLHRRLTEMLSTSIADYIVLYRQYGPSETANDALGSQASAPQFAIDFSVPPAVEVSSLVELIDTQVRIPEAAGEDSDAPPRMFPSPLSLRSTPSGTQPVDEVLDALTVTTLKRIVGRVNVLTAPPEVLAAVPGLSEELAARIVSRRGNSERSFRHPIGLLSSLELDSSIVETVLPHLTVSGDVVKVAATGSLHWGTTGRIGANASQYHCEVILDASDGPTRPLMFRQQMGTTRPTHPAFRPTSTPLP